MQVFMMGEGMNVLVINQCAHNKGDRAVLAFVLQELARNGISRVTVSTSDRGYWEDAAIDPLLNVSFVPWGWDVERHLGYGRKIARVRRRLASHSRLWYPIVRHLTCHDRHVAVDRICCSRDFSEALRGADLVVSTGGHHVTTWLSPNAVSPQVFDMALAIQARKKLILWSQSIGPLEFNSPKDADFIRNILINTHAVYIRDQASVSELEKLGGVFRVYETLESVIGLTPSHRDHIPLEERASILGISVYTTKKRSKDAHKKYVGTMAALVDHAVRCGLTPKFFPMALKGTSADDRPTIRQIIAASQLGHESLVVDQDLPTLAHIREVAKCKAFVGHKTHSIIFSLVSATPILAIAYHQKACDFMSQFNLLDYCLADSDLTQVTAIDLLEKVLANLETISSTERENALNYAMRVRSDFASMLQI